MIISIPKTGIKSKIAIIHASIIQLSNFIIIKPAHNSTKVMIMIIKYALNRLLKTSLIILITKETMGYL